MCLMYIRQWSKEVERVRSVILYDGEGFDMS